MSGLVGQRASARKQRRLIGLLVGLAGLALAGVLVVLALGEGADLFVTPSEIETRGVQPGQRVRLGGLVEEGSITKPGGTVTTFEVTDGAGVARVSYDGILPALFRGGQGVVVEGRLDQQGLFVADTVLAKHDENYMPREVAERLKAEGLWQDEDGAAYPTDGSRPTNGTEKVERP